MPVRGMDINYGRMTSPMSTQKKGIDRINLPPLWLTSINAMFRGLAERDFRPRTWEEYVRLLFDLRRDVVTAMKQLLQRLEQYFQVVNSSG